MKRILVTGADGFIGSHLSEELVAMGYQVRCFTQYNSFNSWGWLDRSPEKIAKEYEIFSGDIRDPYGVKKAMMGCDAVIHLAALIAIPYSYHSPETYIDTNVKGTLNVLQAARELEVERVIHTSTSEVYGTAITVPIDENHPLQGQSPYSASKIAADQLAYSFFTSFDLPVVTIRPFNTYGPRQSARALIPSVIIQILNGSHKVELGSLTPTRDFTFVSDTVNGFICALESENGVGEVINLGGNFEISIKDTVDQIARVMNEKIEVVTKKDRLRPEKSEVDRLWSNNSKAKLVIDWQPRLSGLQGFRQGLEKTIEWFSVEENLSQYKSNIYNI